MKNISLAFSTCILLLLLSYSNFSHAQKTTIEREEGAIKVDVLAEGLVHPWGIAFLPDGRLLVTERPGRLRILESDSILSEPLTGIPELFAVGQGGLLDVALDPDFETNQFIYLSYAAPGEADSTAATALGRGRLEGNEIRDFERIFLQEPYIKGPNHFGGRIVFTEDGKLFLTLGERFQFEPAQDNSNHLGTIVRLNKDGSVPEDNSLAGEEGAKPEIWSYGHRNTESSAIDPRTGNLWIAEMGPMGGDELNLAQAGKNYGWPVVSWGRNYDGSEIPDPPTRPEFEKSKIVWTPTISPSGMEFYDGNLFPEWQDHVLIGGLTSSGIVVVKIDGEKAEEVERIPLSLRIRDVEVAPDGSVYVITDHENGMILKVRKLEGE